MCEKIKDWFKGRGFGPHWFKLLIADSVMAVMAGGVAYIFNHGLSDGAAHFLTVCQVLSIHLLCYIVCFLLFRTCNSFMYKPVSNFCRVVSALVTATVMIFLLNAYSAIKIMQVFDFRDIILQTLFTGVGLSFMRELVKLHYDLYGRRASSNGAYGLSDISLLNMEMSELLQRPPIEVDMEAIHREMHGKRIMVTGAGGSIGSELVRMLAGYGPEMLILIDQAETSLYDMRMLMDREYPSVPYTCVVTDICHRHRMERIFDRFRPEIIFHAAAYKHVPMMEDNPVESVLNNVDGTVKLADLAVRYGAGKFVMISTDKAVNPANVMGCSKRICEIYCQSLARSIGSCGSCQFITTRFGNVLGSNGSVVPIFREQIRRGGPVTVTHPDIIRYFMLIPEACALVLEAATIGHGGEIFAFDMGEPVRISDLAKRMIAISRRRDIKIEYIGLRPGEKLFEEVLMSDETVQPTSHDKIKIAKVREYDFAEVSLQVAKLIETARTYDKDKTVGMMESIVPEFMHKKNR